jgi:hypothetical protein
MFKSERNYSDGFSYRGKQIVARPMTYGSDLSIYLNARSFSMIYAPRSSADCAFLIWSRSLFNSQN